MELYNMEIKCKVRMRYRDIVTLSVRLYLNTEFTTKEKYCSSTQHGRYKITRSVLIIHNTILMKMSVITGNVQFKIKWSYQYNNQLHWRWLITQLLNHWVVNSTQSFKPKWGIATYTDIGYLHESVSQRGGKFCYRNQLTNNINCNNHEATVGL